MFGRLVECCLEVNLDRVPVEVERDRADLEIAVVGRGVRRRSSDPRCDARDQLSELKRLRQEPTPCSANERHGRLVSHVPGRHHKPIDGIGRCCQFTLKAAAGTLIHQPVSEQRIVPKKEAIAEIHEERLKVILASASIMAPVKEALQKAVGMRAGLEQVMASLRDLRAQLKEINEEQTRLRTNLEKLPPMSELYKRYLSKLDIQETSLEKVQSQITEKVADEKKQKKEYDGYLEKLTVE